jgi:hypothetical protein
MTWFTESPLRRVVGALVVLAGAALLLSITGCSMSVDKNDERGGKKVSIETPFGDMKVRDEASAKDTGLPVYPGATPKPHKQGDDDKGQASVSMSMFGLKVAVVSFVSDDDPAKVIAWYRSELKPLGRVVECTESGDDVGNASVHGDSDDADDKPVSCDNKTRHGSREITQFKMGTERNQKVVAIAKRKDGKSGAEFALVRVIVGKGKGDSI